MKVFISFRSYYRSQAYGLTKQLTPRSPSWDFTNYSTTQQFSGILWNPEVRFCAHRARQWCPILSHMNPVHTTYAPWLEWFISVLTRAPYWSLSWARLIYSIPIIYLRSILILFFKHFMEPRRSSPCWQGPPVVPILSQINPVHTTSLPKIHSNMILLHIDLRSDM
jgi:hypothetical protein